MSAVCSHCAGTGSLSKKIDGDYLDCAHCNVATQRAAFEAWVADEIRVTDDHLAVYWKVYQHGKAAALEQAAKDSLEAEMLAALMRAYEQLIDFGNNLNCTPSGLGSISRLIGKAKRSQS